MAFLSGDKARNNAEGLFLVDACRRTLSHDDGAKQKAHVVANNNTEDSITSRAM